LEIRRRHRVYPDPITDTHRDKPVEPGKRCVAGGSVDQIASLHEQTGEIGADLAGHAHDQCDAFPHDERSGRANAVKSQDFVMLDFNTRGVSVSSQWSTSTLSAYRLLHMDYDSPSSSVAGLRITIARERNMLRLGLDSPLCGT